MKSVTDWTVKNDRRKAGKAGGKREYREGRYYRKALGTGGAFGDLPAKLYNLCVQGTSSSPKREKKDKQTYDDRSDYDS